MGHGHSTNMLASFFFKFLLVLFSPVILLWVKYSQNEKRNKHRRRNMGRRNNEKEIIDLVNPSCEAKTILLIKITF